MQNKNPNTTFIADPKTSGRLLGRRLSQQILPTTSDDLIAVAVQRHTIVEDEPSQSGSGMDDVQVDVKGMLDTIDVSPLPP